MIRVALLFGGRSAEHEVSIISASSIYKYLDKKKYKAVSVYINRDGKWRVVESPLLSASALKKGCFSSFLPWGKRALPRAIRADIYFPVLHGPYGEDGTIQGLLEMADVAFVGASVTASAIAMDKALTKMLFKAKNLPVVKHLVLLEEDWRKNKKSLLSQIKKEIPLPFFVKPACLGSSVGISKVKDHAQLPAALDLAFRYDRKILAEKGVKGREFECSVLGNDNPQASLPGELIPHREFYDYRDKYIEGKTRFKIPADLPPAQIKKIKNLSLQAYKAVSCSGMARVDFLMEGKTGEIFVSEINTIPGFTEISMYPKLWEVSGLPYPRLLEKLIELGFERHSKKKRNTESPHS